MNSTDAYGNWDEQKDKLKEKFAMLMDNEQIFDEAKKEEMLGKLQVKLGKTKEELDQIITTL